MIRTPFHALVAAAAVGGAWMGVFRRFLHAAVVDGGGRFFT